MKFIVLYHYSVLANAIIHINYWNEPSQGFFCCRSLNLCTCGHFMTKKAPALIILGQKRIAHDHFTVCVLNTKSFYHGLKYVNTVTFVQKKIKRLLRGRLLSQLKQQILVNQLQWTNIIWDKVFKNGASEIF